MRFVDTSFWVALRYRRDPRHEQAAALWRGDREPLLTTNHVLGETWTFLRRRLDHSSARRFADAVAASRRLSVVHVEDAEEQEAWEWLRRHDERAYSFVDATSFTVMRRRRLRHAMAFDGDFAAAGFVELRP